MSRPRREASAAAQTVPRTAKPTDWVYTSRIPGWFRDGQTIRRQGDRFVVILGGVEVGAYSTIIEAARRADAG